jgi:UDP-N-acetylmuramate dehydrogenase
MQILENVSLKDYSTMRLGGIAAFVTEVHDRMEMREAIAWGKERNLPVIMIGGGSNIIWRDEGFPGLIIVNKILRFEEQMPDETDYYVTVGAGENWDSVVERVVAKGMTGVEALSLIPGTAGATPVQNVGAYGQEIANVLLSVEAYDITEDKFVSLAPTDCNFGYRTSRFKAADKGRFFISAITLHLTKGNPQPPFYLTLGRYLEDNHITTYTPQTIRDAIIAIRSSKLPDPAVVANNGSFFTNPTIDAGTYAQLKADYGEIPYRDMGDDRVKIPAALLLEKAGLKDYHDPATGMCTWAKQPLVLVNEHAQTTAQLVAFKQMIVDTVKQKFDITLEQEPEILP